MGNLVTGASSHPLAQLAQSLVNPHRPHLSPSSHLAQPVTAALLQFASCSSPLPGAVTVAPLPGDALALAQPPLPLPNHTVNRALPSRSVFFPRPAGHHTTPYCCPLLVACNYCCEYIDFITYFFPSSSGKPPTCGCVKRLFSLLAQSSDRSGCRGLPSR